MHLLWDSLRFSRLAPDDKTIELLLLLLTLVEQLRPFIELPKAQLEQFVLVFKPDTLLRWHRELVRRKWTFNQQARQFVWNLPEQKQRLTHFIRDNDGKYEVAFDAVFASEGIEVVHTPVRVHGANKVYPNVKTAKRMNYQWVVVLS